MTLAQFIARVIDTARTGQTPDAQAQLSAMESEVETLLAQGLQELAERIGRDNTRRHLLQKRFELVLEADQRTGAQYAPLDNAVLSDCLAHGVLGDDVQGAQEPLSQYEYIKHFADFARPLTPGYPYYTLHLNAIYLKSTSANFTDNDATLYLETSYVPVLSEVPPVLEDDLIMIVANKLTGMIANAKAS